MLVKLFVCCGYSCEVVSTDFFLNAVSIYPNHVKMQQVYSGHLPLVFLYAPKSVHLLLKTSVLNTFHLCNNNNEVDIILYQS